MEDGAVEGLPQVAAVRSRPGIDRVGGEPDLVVYDDMYGPADVEVFDARHLHCLVDNALAGEGGIAMEEDRDDSLGVLGAVAAVELLRPALPNDERVNAFKVTRVRDETQMDPSPVGVSSVHGRPEVVLYISRHVPLLYGLSVDTFDLEVVLDVVVGALELRRA